MSCPIVPAIIPSSQEEIISLAQKLTFTHEIQLDLVDGRFVEAISWPYEPKGQPMAVKPFTDAFTLEVDLMVAEPLLAARDWVKAGADMLVFHVETISLDVFSRYMESAEVSIGVSMHGKTDMDVFLQYVALADYVQLMGIETIGAQGLPFDEKVLDRIKTVKSAFPNKMISIDGSVNKDTIKRLAAAGATRFVAGSAVVKQVDIEAAYEELHGLVNG